MPPSDAADLIPVRRFVRTCKRQQGRPKVADSSGLRLTAGRLLAASIVLKRVLTRRVLDRNEQHVGILLPPSVAGILANTALALARRVAVNLNYTLSQENMASCVEQAGLRHVITSRRVMEKLPFQIDAKLLYVEDLKELARPFDKAAAVLQVYALPASLVERLHGLDCIDPDEPLTVIFTSGSTGEPKGVMLSHRNVGSNIMAVHQAVHIRRDDVLLGILPFFHSFGYTATLWLVLALEPQGAYHFKPLDARQVGQLCETHGVTIIMSAPTFLRTYLKRCTPQQLRTLNLVVTGAEKLPLELARQFKDKYGVEPSEGYGTTELSPVVAVNVPDDRFDGPPGGGTKLGTIGRPLPGIQVKIVHPDSGEDLPAGNQGLLFVKGPNVMLGYLNLPDASAKVLRDGWYNTGDIARIDADGFIEITGRQSRFSKMGGEMVPHLKVEEAIVRLLEDPGGGQEARRPVEAGDSDEPDVKVAVTSVPDESKGERLIVLHKPLDKSVAEIRRALAEAGLPNLWIPAADGFIKVDEIPVLGSGKLDLKRVKQLALEKAGAVAVSSC